MKDEQWMVNQDKSEMVHHDKRLHLEQGSNLLVVYMLLYVEMTRDMLLNI
jgi:hypothetical protein